MKLVMLSKKRDPMYVLISYNEEYVIHALRAVSFSAVYIATCPSHIST